MAAYSVVVLQWLLIFMAYTYRTQFFFSQVAYKMPKDIGRRPQRDGDQSLVVPHIYEGDSITIFMCTEAWSTITFDNLTFSNDGASDTIRISLNGRKLNSVVTPFQTKWGAYWDMFIRSGPIGSTGLIPPGEHILRFDVVQSGDCYGVEIGTLYVSIDIPINVSRFWCGSDFSFAPTKQECMNEVPTQKQTQSSSIQPTTSLAITSSTLTTTKTTTTTVATTTTTTTTTTMKPTTTVFPDLVMVEQQSYRTECLDSQNVRIKFTRRDLVGTRIVAYAENTRHPPDFTEREVTSGAKTCKSNMWQLGVIDDNNREFKLLVPNSNVDFNITNKVRHTSDFPGKILPFATLIITIRFRIPDNIFIDNGSIFFAIGLVNLTKETQIGLQYFDINTNSLSEIQFLKFTPRWHVMGWNIPSLEKSNTKDNVFILHFDSRTNVIMFDFLRLDFSTIEERKRKSLLHTSDMFKVRGYKYRGMRGMTVSVNKQTPVGGMDSVVVLFRSRDSDTYHGILSVNKDGLINPYHKMGASGMQPNILFDMFGFMIHKGIPGGPSAVRTPVHSLHIDIGNTVVDLQLRYKDGSVLRLRVTPSGTMVQIVITNLQLAENAMYQSLTYVSAHVTDYVAAVNEVKIDDNVTTPVMTDLSNFSGNHIFSFRKTSPTNIYHVSPVMDIIFERHV